MKTKKSTRVRTEAFKREAVRQMEQRGEQTVDDIAASVGVSPGLLYAWRLQLGSQISGTTAETPELELRRLRRENTQLRQERDILKKATAFFAREHS